MIKMKNNKKIKMIVISLITIFALSVAGTYAWITFTTSYIFVGGNTHCFDINYTKQSDITGNIGIINENDYLTSSTIKLSTVMGYTYISLELDESCYKTSGVGVISLNVDSLSSAFTDAGNSYESLKYVVASYDSSLYAEPTIEYLKNQTFNYLSKGIISSTGTIDIHTENLSPGEKHEYLLIIYIDRNKTGDDIIGASVTASSATRVNQFVPNSITDFTYSTDTYNGITVPSNTVLLTGYTGTSSIVNIPSTYVINDTTYDVMVYSNTSNNTSTFSGNTTITNIVFADGVKFYIYDGTNLIDNRVDGLFRGCTNLLSAPKLPNIITSMNNTFEGCSSLTNVKYLPSGVTSMLSTFKDCTNLEGNIRIVNSSASGDSNTFSGTTKNIILEVPTNSNIYTTLNGNVPSNVKINILNS